MRRERCQKKKKKVEKKAEMSTAVKKMAGNCVTGWNSSAVIFFNSIFSIIGMITQNIEWSPKSVLERVTVNKIEWLAEKNAVKFVLNFFVTCLDVKMYDHYNLVVVTVNAMSFVPFKWTMILLVFIIENYTNKMYF